MDNDALLVWANAQFVHFKNVDNLDRAEKYASIMATCMQTRVLNGLSVWVQKNLAAKHEG